MKLIVLTSTELEPAYRLAGTATIACADAGEAERTLRELLGGGTAAVIAVHQPFLDGLDAGFRAGLDELESALVVGLPDGAAETGADDRRARLTRMLRRAVGYEMTFESEGGARG